MRRIVSLCPLLIAFAACLDRPVTAESPTLKTSFTTVRQATTVDKVDLLFMIDNSASMGDKQNYLAEAIPDLLNRLVTPNCVDVEDETHVLGVSHGDGVCDQGKVEFPPVHDMHIGIVSSSLGARGGTGMCDPRSPDTAHLDDRAHLLNRAGDDEHPVTDAEPSSFLAWFPSTEANAGKTAGARVPGVADATMLGKDFTDLVSGVHQQGCGIESQLESWYRFLIQPDPYDHIDTSGAWQGVDAALLQQRHDFLRPDSLVAIVDLTDENDSEIDVRSFGGHGVDFMRAGWAPPKGTSVCATDPGNAACTTCLSLSAAQAAADPRCAAGLRYTQSSDWGMNANLRHVHMKEKYGVDPQFPIQRYVDGLTKPTTLARDGTSCTNPLFAAELATGTNLDPTALCGLPVGLRSPNLVFYAHIGGVPSTLLHFQPGHPSSYVLTEDDWTKILGKDPLAYDLAGIDPHMIESFEPRPGLPPPTAANDADPITGREWNTVRAADVDVEYACTFPLAAPRACVGNCDCTGAALTPDQVPPVCDPANPAMQIRAKAYPTIRELLLAKLLGAQGIVSSICPIHPAHDPANPSDPLYGYRPAVAAIVERLKSAFLATCVPHPLKRDPTTGSVPCLVLETMAGVSGGEGACSQFPGLTAPDPQVVKSFLEQRSQLLGTSQDVTNTPPVCQSAQLVGADIVNGTCTASTHAGWCYVTDDANGTCTQEISFSGSGNPRSGTIVSLQCIEE